MTYILFFVGFYLLIKGADLLVDGASSLAKRFGISPLVVGLTIVSFGTSAPELIVSVMSSLNGSGDISIGNVVGSNIANILLILGCSAALFPLAVKKSTVWKEIPLALLASILLGVIANDVFFDNPAILMLNGEPFFGLTRTDGIVFLSLFLIFIFYTFGISKAESADMVDSEIISYTPQKSILFILVGLIGLFVGGNWVVGGASNIARAIGFSEAFIGLTLVAIGTSLPELFTSIIAAKKGDIDIAVGNVVGSNIFNIFLVLGLSALITPIGFSGEMITDVIFSIFVTILLFSFMFIGEKRVLQRSQGIMFIVLYLIYTIAIFIRG